MAGMLLGHSSGPAATDASGGVGGGGSAEGADLQSGIKLGALGCLRDAADQQRLNRPGVIQVR